MVATKGITIKSLNFRMEVIMFVYYIFIIIPSKKGIKLHENTVPPSQPLQAKAKALKQPCEDTIEGKIPS